jgi:hypothetical protein
MYYSQVYKLCMHKIVVGSVALCVASQKLSAFLHAYSTQEKGNGLCNKEVEEIVRLKLLVFGVPWNQRRKLFSLFITSIYI